MGLDFVSVDFETANRAPSSACALGLAFVCDGRLTSSASYRIRPPTRRFVFSRVHRLTWEDVRDAPAFPGVWHEVEDRLKSEILIAHNAAFEKAVLYECLRHYGLRYRLNPFLCSMELSREVFGFTSLRLDYVCDQLNISLHHHDAESDARAAANIVIQAATQLEIDSTTRLLEFCKRFNSRHVANVKKGPRKSVYAGT